MKLTIVFAIISLAGLVAPAPGLFFTPRGKPKSLRTKVSPPANESNNTSPVVNDVISNFTLPSLDFVGTDDRFTVDFWENVDKRLENLTIEVDEPTNDFTFEVDVPPTSNEEELDDILDKILRENAVSNDSPIEESFLRRMKKKIILNAINLTGRIMIKVVFSDPFL